MVSDVAQTRAVAVEVRAKASPARGLCRSRLWVLRVLWVPLGCCRASAARFFASHAALLARTSLS